MMAEEKKFYPLSTEYDQTHTYFMEEFPEGSYGCPVNHDLSKDEWKEDMHPAPAFSYEARSFHEGLERDYPGAHITHDDPKTSVQGPYDQDDFSQTK